jgi:hypothetical protein
MNLAKKLKAVKERSLYQRVAIKFNTNVSYVCDIANGRRNPTKKKGLEIKKHLEAEIAKMEQIKPVNNL